MFKMFEVWEVFLDWELHPATPASGGTSPGIKCHQCCFHRCRPVLGSPTPSAPEDGVRIQSHDCTGTDCVSSQNLQYQLLFGAWLSSSNSCILCHSIVCCMRIIEFHFPGSQFCSSIWCVASGMPWPSTWMEAPRPSSRGGSGASPLGSRWIYSMKLNESSNLKHLSINLYAVSSIYGSPMESCKANGCTQVIKKKCCTLLLSLFLFFMWSMFMA